MVRLQAHRGVASEYPENTMAAFNAAIEQGYALIELDPKYTADGKFVILHDRSLKRTARDSDGNAPELAIAEITYDEAKSYEYGSWFDERFKGETIPTLDDVLCLAENNPSAALKLDNVWESFPDELKRAFLSGIAAHGAKNVGITCKSLDGMKLASEYLPYCELHYDGADLSDETLRQVKAIAEDHRLTIWICYDNENTRWFKGEKASVRLCERVKAYGDIGVWLLTEKSELDEAVSVFGASAVETTGSLKVSMLK